MKIAHGYEGIALNYFKARPGTPKFAEFMFLNSGVLDLVKKDLGRPIYIAEFGVGSGQQTGFVEAQLEANGVTDYRILAFDKSYSPNPNGRQDQLNLLKDRIGRGELSDRVIPIQCNIDGIPLPIPTGKVDLSYMAFVQPHLIDKEGVMREIARITRQGCPFFLFGATSEDPVAHPYDIFFPSMGAIQKERYPTYKQLTDSFKQSGFKYRGHCRLIRDKGVRIDRALLEQIDPIEDIAINSTLQIIRKEYPEEFQQGVDTIRKIVEQLEETGGYITFDKERTIYWGIKR
ncbi:hypothetical protein CMO93_04655 [Candidatus Woesearchaeota archaeon]|nr:hypothetical protein [Candidatus Woesearchaeota archaeon]|tara:strand:- start:3383 stop:4249 length:867 start_codon:yes stop_codon:yes gene_type:complete